jgi:hypothetical protein
MWGKRKSNERGILPFHTTMLQKRGYQTCGHDVNEEYVEPLIFAFVELVQKTLKSLNSASVSSREIRGGFGRQMLQCGSPIQRLLYRRQQQ